MQKIKVMKKKNIIGYTTGVFDMFHVGHLNILKKAKKNCDYLIVAVCTDKLTKKLKKKKPIIPFKDRYEIIKSIKYVDQVVAEKNDNKIKDWKKYKYNIIFKGNDWKYSVKWKILKKFFLKNNVKINFFPYTNSYMKVDFCNQQEILIRVVAKQTCYLFLVICYWL